MGKRRRIIGRACIVLMLGAIINVAVAWLMGFEADVRLVNPARTRCSIDTADAIDRAWLAEIADDCPAATALLEGVGSITLSKGRGLLLREYSGFPFGTNLGGRAPLPFSIQYRCGWPNPSIVGGGYQISDARPRWINPVGGVEWAYAIVVTKTLNGHDGIFARILPLKPLFPGFAINTIFYAAVLWVIFAAPVKLRRWHRIKRGQCESCGYSLQGIPDDGACPECGTTR